MTAKKIKKKRNDICEINVYCKNLTFARKNATICHKNIAKTEKHTLAVDNVM